MHSISKKNFECLFTLINLILNRYYVEDLGFQLPFYETGKGVPRAFSFMNRYNICKAFLFMSRHKAFILIIFQKIAYVTKVTFERLFFHNQQLQYLDLNYFQKKALVTLVTFVRLFPSYMFAIFGFKSIFRKNLLS